MREIQNQEKATLQTLTDEIAALEQQLNAKRRQIGVLQEKLSRNLDSESESSVASERRVLSDQFGRVDQIAKNPSVAEHESQTLARWQALIDSAPVMMGLVDLEDDDSVIVRVVDNHASSFFFDEAGLFDEAVFFDEADSKFTGRCSRHDPGATPKVFDLWVQNFRLSQSRRSPVRFLYRHESSGEPERHPQQGRWLNMIVSHLGKSDANRDQFCYIAFDDTQRVESEAESEWVKSRETFAKLLTDAPFGVYLVDDDLVIQAISQGAERAFENVMPVVGKRLDDVLRVLWDEEFAAEAVGQFVRTLQTGQSYETTQTTRQRKDIGTLQSYHWQLKRIHLPGNRSGVVCYYYDLTPLKQAEHAAKQSEGRLRLATDLANVGVITIDYLKEEAVLDATSAALFELPESTPVPRASIHDKFHPDDNAGLQDEINAAYHNKIGGLLCLEHRIVQADGTVRWLDVRKRVSFEKENDSDPPTATHAVAAILDVTAQKKHESELNAALMQAEAANRARGEFLANMSHEIRTPMTAILGYADILGEQLKDPESLQGINTIRRNGRFLLDIINDILDLSKIDAGKMNPERERVKPQAIVADVVSLMNVRAEEKKIDLIADFDGQIPETIETDAKRLRQILLNLTGNAIKFTSEGEVHLKSRFNHKTKKLEFEISDTGIGMTAEQIGFLFQPFTQVDATHTRSFGGTGLGLAISRRLARVLGGDISVESHFGTGSTFIVSIDPGPTEDVQFGIPSLVGAEAVQQSGHVKLEGHYLIVDDRRDIRFLAQTIVEKAGGTVTTANDGREGVDLVFAAEAADTQFAAVLMDMQMPVMDGYSAVAEIRRREIDVPIIALTANAMSEDRDKCLKVGCTDFLTKPLDKRVLLELIASLPR